MESSVIDKSTSSNPVVTYQLNGNCYINVTNRCNLRCEFCPKFNGTWEVRGCDLRLVSEPSVASMLLAVGDPMKYKEVVFCGLGEPTLRLYQVLEVAWGLRRRHAERIRLNSDGLANLVHGKDVTPDFEGYIDALSVSLNGHNAKIYEKHCRPVDKGSFNAVLDFVSKAKTFVPDVTLTTINGLEGVDIVACRQIAAELGVGFRERVLGKVG